MNRLTDDPATIDAILADGAARARSLAEPIMSDVRKLVGFLSN
jgi:tryptophanyl-tRNA synthetase